MLEHLTVREPYLCGRKHGLRLDVKTFRTLAASSSESRYNVIYSQPFVLVALIREALGFF